MKLRIPGCALGLLALSGAAVAGGLDRTGQPMAALFEDGGETGGYAELTIARTVPNVTGNGAGLAPYLAPGGAYENTGGAFTSISGAVKVRLSDRLSAALIVEEPYGSDVLYPGNGTTSELGNTLAWAETQSLTGLLRYKFDDHWSMHGGIRIQQIEGDIRLSGWAYGPPRDMGYPTANGYDVDLDQDVSAGYVVGLAYEIPEIALRAALTYNSTITHEMDTVEHGNPNPALDGHSVTEVKTPQSVNLDLQTGIAQSTLLYGSLRWAKWSEFRIDPEGFTQPISAGGGGVGLVDLDDTVTYTLGAAYRFNDVWAGSAEVFYEPREDGIVAPLFPSVGFWGVGAGVSHEIGDMTVSLAARYTKLGDGRVETLPPGVPRAFFRDNEALTLAMRVGYEF